MGYKNKFKRVKKGNNNALFLNGVTGAGFALFLNHKRQKETPDPNYFSDPLFFYRPK